VQRRRGWSYLFHEIVENSWGEGDPTFKGQGKACDTKKRITCETKLLELYLFCKPREPIYYIYVFFVETIGRRRYISIIFCFVFPPTSWSKKLEKTRRGCETKKVILAATRANKNCGQ